MARTEPCPSTITKHGTGWPVIEPGTQHQPGEQSVQQRRGLFLADSLFNIPGWEEGGAPLVLSSSWELLD